MTSVDWTVDVSRTLYTQNLAHKCRTKSTRSIKSIKSIKGIYLKHLAIEKNEIKLWSKMLNSKNIELRSQGK